MSLRTKAITGVKWMTVSTIATAVVSFLQTVALSHILDRRDFGLMSMAWVIVGFTQNFADMGMSNALVRKQDATPQQLSSVYWLNLFVGTTLATAVWVSTPMIVNFYREPDIGGIIPWLAAALVLTSTGQPFRMLAQRDMSFHRLAAAEILAVLSGTTVAIGSALAGQGPYSLAFGGLATAFVRASVLITTGWRSWHPTLHFHRHDLNDFLRFGLFQLGDKTANYIWSTADYLAVGRILGADALGVYRLAYELVNRPFAILNPIVTTVAYPIFAKKQNDNDALRRGIIEIIQLIGTLVFPVTMGLMVVAPAAVQVVFGEKWAAVAPLVQILGLVGTMRALGNPVGLLLMSKGRVDLGFYWSVGLAVVCSITFWLIAPLGLVAVCWSAVLIQLLQLTASFKFLYGKTIQLSARKYCRAFTPPLLLCCVMAAAVLLTDQLIIGFALPALIRLAILIAVGVATYAGLSITFAREYILQLRAALMQRNRAA